jgi:hypothetical protein
MMKNQDQHRGVCPVIDATTAAAVHRPRRPTETGLLVRRIESVEANKRGRGKDSVVISALTADTSLQVLCDWAFVMVAMMIRE